MLIVALLAIVEGIIKLSGSTSNFSFKIVSCDNKYFFASEGFNSITSTFKSE